MGGDRVRKIVMLSLLVVAAALPGSSGAVADRPMGGGYRIEAKSPATSPKSRGTGEDLRDKILQNAPVVLKGAVIIIGATLLVMTLVLVPIGWMRRVVTRESEKSGGFALPSSRKYYVKLGSLGVPSEFEWRPPNLIIGGNRFGMQLATKIDKLTWQMENGTRFEFVSKEEVEQARARHEAEFKARQEAERAQREFRPEEAEEEEGPT